MSRKQKPVTLLADGEYKTDGVYRSGGPKLSMEESKRRLHEFVDDCHRPAVDRIRDIRAWLTGAITPHVDGPHESQSVSRGEVEGWIEPLTLDGARGMYRVNAERRTWVEDAIDALRENLQIEKLLVNAENIDLIVRLSVRQGQAIERIQLRALIGPSALIGARKSRKETLQAERTNQKRAAARPDYNKYVKDLMRKRKIKYTPACKQVADDLGVTKETVRNNTPGLRPGPKRK